MPSVTIVMFKGRTISQKRRMVKVVSSRIAEALPIPQEHVRIIIQDIPKTN